MYSVRETADIYSKITKPKFVDTLDKSHVDWMHNVLEGKKETELCLFENDHFKLQKDYKFNEGDLSTLYLLAMPKAAPTKQLHSIRDLTADHLPVLKSICEESYKVIQEKYGIPSHKIYAYFHYLPTYWLLHIHFVHVDKASRDAREQIPLEAAIFNLEMNNQYYKLATLQYTVGDRHDLFKVLLAEGILTEYVDPKETIKPQGETEVD